MHKYLKELNENKEIVGICDITYKTNEEWWSYISKVFEAVEISEKEYDMLRKQLSLNEK